jgi:uncharacterized membrane protein
VRVLIGILTTIGVLVAIRRLIALHGAGAGLDEGFLRHATLTAAHVIPGMLFLLIGPFQFASSNRRRRPVLHRWMGRIFVVAGAIVGITALVMSPQMAIGGPVESAATTVFGAWFLFALGNAYTSIRRRDVTRHRQWMIRAYSTGLAVTTIRPIVGMFFATSRLTGLTPRDFFGIAFWIGFTAHVIAAELWISRSTRDSGFRWLRQPRPYS